MDDFAGGRTPPDPGRIVAGRNYFIGAVAIITLVATGCAGSPDPADTTGLSASTTVLPQVGAPTTAPPTTEPSTTVPTAPTTTVPVPTTTVAAPTTTAAPIPAPGSFRAASTLAKVGPCPLYPTDHFLNATNVDTLPVHPQSTTWTNYLGGDATLLKTPSSKIWAGARAGIPLNIVDSNTLTKSDVRLNQSWTTRGYNGKYPIPANPKVEGYPSVQWDQHLLMLDTADCMAYELIGYEPKVFQFLGLHTALSGIRYPVDSSDVPVLTTNAANTPMIGQYLRVDEVNAGNVPHVVGFCSNLIRNQHVWPAQASDGTESAANAIPMGAWLRLKSDVDLRGFTGQAAPIARAMREHGMVLTDICGHRLSVMSENADGWVEKDIDQLKGLKASDFEVVDPSAMKTNNASFVIR